MTLFFGFQYGLMSSISTGNCQTASSDTTARVFNKSRTARAVVLDNSKAFHRIGNVILLHRLMSYEIYGQILELILSLFNNRQFLVVLDGNFSKISI